MTTKEVATKLVELCKKHQNLEAVQTLYAKDVVSIEPMAMGDMPAETKGLEGVVGKTKWWIENHIVHGGETVGPFIHGDKFAVKFDVDVTFKPTNKRMKMSEVGVYSVANGKVIREEFYYGEG